MKIRLTLKQVRVGVIIAALMLASGWFGWRIGKGEITAGRLTEVVVDRSQPAEKSQIDLSMFWRVWDRLGETYLTGEDLKAQEMVWGAIKGMTSSLGDPYTVFLPPERNKETKEELEGAFEGVGIQLGFKDGRLAVIAPLAGMPAEKVGVRAGDLILHIEEEKKGVDVDTTDMSLPEAVKIIRGPKGTPIKLTLLHEGETEVVEVEIVRDTIVIKSVDLNWVGEAEAVAHLRLSRFGGRTEVEWNEAVSQIIGKKPKGIVLDLRNNPGGYLQGAVRYAGEFLERGLIVVKQEDSQGRIETYSVSHQGRLLSQPLVVLINQGSASSSEILAGALRDHSRAKLVGQKTFGKGTIQEAIDLGEGAGLHVTTAKWLLPSGEWVNETEGIMPEIEVESKIETEDIDEQLQKAIEQLQS